jgi:hypothetical protein
MKTIITVALFAIISVSFSQINSGLVVNCPFDENIKNLFTTPVNSYNGIPQFVKDGNRCALSLEGNSLRTGYNIASSNNQFSFSFYFKLEKLPQNNFQSIILGRIPALALKNDTLLFLDWFSENNLKYKLKINTWHHVAFTFDGININAFINSLPIGSYKLENYFDAFLYIGNGNTFLIDDLRIYNRIISTSEINELYNLPSSCIITSITENEIITYDNKKVVFACDILGKEIEEPSSFSGIIILYYSDGSKEKVLNTAK